MLQAMNTGTTARSPRSTRIRRGRPVRLETMVLMADSSFRKAIREQISSALNAIIQVRA